MAYSLGTLLDTCVLAVLTHSDTYGYDLTQRVMAVMDISESTLYPVLRRLLAEGCLTAYDQPFQGRNRRYYSITALGRQRCEFQIGAWNEYKKQVDSLLQNQTA